VNISIPVSSPSLDRMFYCRSRVQHHAIDLPTAKTSTVTNFGNLGTHTNSTIKINCQILCCQVQCDYPGTTEKIPYKDDDIPHFTLTAYCSILASVQPRQLVQTACPYHC